MGTLAKRNTPEANWLSSVRPQSRPETRSEARVKSSHRPPRRIRFNQHIPDLVASRDVVFDVDRFYEGPEGYAREAIVQEVVELLALPELMVEDDIAIDELLTRRQRRSTTQKPAESSTEASKEGDTTHRIQQLLTHEASVSGRTAGGGMAGSIGGMRPPPHRHRQLEVLRS